MWSWLKKNYWVPLVFLVFVALYLMTAGRFGNPFAKLNKLRRKLDKEYQEAVKEVDKHTDETISNIETDRLNNRAKLEEEVKDEAKKLANPDNHAELVAKLRKLYSDREHDM